MFFSTVSHFPDAKDDRIDILPFLEASKGIVRFVELLGTVFSPVKYDINGNIEKLHKIHLSNETKFVTLNDIIEFELNEENKVGIDALLWLKRALEYVHVFLTCLVYDSKGGSSPDNLCPYFNKAYEEKLKPYHGWFVQKLFGIMVHAAPSRKSLIHLLAGDDESASEEQILNDVETFNPAVSRQSGAHHFLNDASWRQLPLGGDVYLIRLHIVCTMFFPSSCQFPFSCQLPFALHNEMIFDPLDHIKYTSFHTFFTLMFLSCNRLTNQLVFRRLSNIMATDVT